MHAATPQVQESGQSLIGTRLRPGKLTVPRMTRILRLMALTPTQFNRWCGLTLPEWIKTNPTWTERQLFKLVQENYAAIDQAEAA